MELGTHSKEPDRGNITTYGPIYAQASTGKIKTWTAHIQETSENYGHIEYIFGYEDGKKQSQEKLVTSGKNLGKINETTPYQQACSDAESKYNKKCDEGYQEDKDTLSVPILPMLALPYEKRGHDIQWPCYAQPKIDGVRCTVGYDNGNIKMFTRKGKEMTPMPHIVKDLERLYAQASTAHRIDTLYFDGELYSDSLTFQELAGTLRRHKNSQAVLDEIYFVVFDLFWTDLGTPYENRKNYLDSFFSSFLETTVRQIETRLINKDELDSKHHEFIQSGHEGIMLRNRNGVYKLKHRSTDLQKLKMFKDDEFTIVGAKEGEGVEKGCVIWDVENNVLGRQRFWVRPRGSHEERRVLMKNSWDYIGKKLTVRFQERTDDGIPRFPVGIEIRNYE